MANLLKKWPKLRRVDRQWYANRKTGLPLEAWVSSLSLTVLERKISPEAVPLMSEAELRLMLLCAQPAWGQALIEVLDEKD